MEKNIPFLTFSEGGSSTHVYGSIESLGEAFTLQQIIQNTLNYSGQTETREKSEGENEGDSDRDSDRESVRERGISENWENRLRRTAASARDIERQRRKRESMQESDRACDEKRHTKKIQETIPLGKAIAQPKPLKKPTGIQVSWLRGDSGSQT